MGGNLGISKPPTSPALGVCITEHVPLSKSRRSPSVIFTGLAERFMSTFFTYTEIQDGGCLVFPPPPLFEPPDARMLGGAKINNPPTRILDC